MPRSARKESGYGIYHVMMRGTRGTKESGTVLLEFKNGVWEPLAPEDILEK